MPGLGTGHGGECLVGHLVHLHNSASPPFARGDNDVTEPAHAAIYFVDNIVDLLSVKTIEE